MTIGMRARSSPRPVLGLRGMVLGCLLAGPVAAPAPAGPAHVDEPAAARNAGNSPPRPRLPRENLLLFRVADHAPRPVRSVEDWLQRRAEILAGMQAVM